MSVSLKSTRGEQADLQQGWTFIEESFQLTTIQKRKGGAREEITAGYRYELLFCDVYQHQFLEIFNGSLKFNQKAQTYNDRVWLQEYPTIFFFNILGRNGFNFKVTILSRATSYVFVSKMHNFYFVYIHTAPVF